MFIVFAPALASCLTPQSKATPGPNAICMIQRELGRVRVGQSVSGMRCCVWNDTWGSQYFLPSPRLRPKDQARLLGRGIKFAKSIVFILIELWRGTGTPFDCRKVDLRDQRNSVLGTAFARNQERNPRVFVDEHGKEHILRPIGLSWSGRADSNRGPLAPKASALPGCATPRFQLFYLVTPKGKPVSDGAGSGLRRAMRS